MSHTKSPMNVGKEADCSSSNPTGMQNEFEHFEVRMARFHRIPSSLDCTRAYGARVRATKNKRSSCSKAKAVAPSEV